MTDQGEKPTHLKAAGAGLALLVVGGLGWSLYHAPTEPTEAEQPVRLTALEFRAAAAETRVTWRDPDISAETDGENLVRAKILGFNDFHGSLNAREIGGRPVGGAAAFAAYLKAESSEVDGRAIIVHAGDMVGASPPVSALMRDEPSIGFFNLLANESCTVDDRMAAGCNVVGTLGNHEFDDGSAEVLRLLNGGRHPDAASAAETAGWRGSRAPYVSANVVVAETGELFLPPYVIKDVGGVPVAFIGATLRSAPDVVIAGRIADLAFLDEATAINSYVPELQAKGVRAIVVTIHQGLRQYKFGSDATTGSGGEDKLEGEILTIIGDLDVEIDIVISGHAHGYTNLLVSNWGGRQVLLTQAFSGATAYADIDITLDPASGEIIEKSATIVSTWADNETAPDPKVAAFVEAANIAVKPMVSRVIGVSSMPIRHAQNDAGESLLGSFSTDSVRVAMGTDFAFAGESSIRGHIDVGDIEWGELFIVKPFGNNLVALTLTGDQIYRLLNSQWTVRPNGNILQISGLSYTWDANRAIDDRIVEVRDASGTPIDREAPYRVSASSFLAAGGDGFDVMAEGTDRVLGQLDLDALIDYVQAQPQPVTLDIPPRITRLN